MRHVPFLIAAVAVLLLPGMPASAQSQSAADLYRVAAGALRSQPWTDPLSAPLDASTEAILQTGSRALDLFDVASTVPFGAWGFKEDDPFSASATLPKALDLADWVIVRARMRMKQNQPDAAINDLVNLLQLARRLSVTPSLARQQLQNELTRKAAGAIGQILPDLSPAQVAQFVTRIHDLRSPADPAEALQADARAYLWYHRCVYEDVTFANLVERRPAMIEAVIGKAWKPASVEDLWDNPVSFDLVMLDAERALEDLASALKLSQPQRDIEFGSAIARSSNQHPLVRGASTLALIAVMQSETQQKLMTLLNTALRIGAEAPRPFTEDQIKKLTDDLSLQMLPHGFELRIKGSTDPGLTLTIGSGASTTRPATAPAP